MTIAIIVIAIVALLWFVSTSNNFKRSRLKIDEAQSGIEVALTKRYDTLTKLLDSTKGYMKHEQETLNQVIRMRKGMSLEEMQTASNQMDQVASQIQVTAEAYPELRSSEMFTNLQQAISDAEEHLQAARRLYNANVTQFNTMREVFPSSLLGAKYPKYDLFQAEAHKKADVEMKF